MYICIYIHTNIKSCQSSQCIIETCFSVATPRQPSTSMSHHINIASTTAHLSGMRSEETKDERCGMLAVRGLALGDLALRVLTACVFISREAAHTPPPCQHARM